MALDMATRADGASGPLVGVNEPTISDLQREISRLRDKLAEACGVRSDSELAFLEWFGVSPASARVLGALYSRARQPVRFATLLNAAAVCSTRNALGVHVCHLREAMDDGSISTIPGIGYSLTAIGVAECNAILRLWNTMKFTGGE